MEERRRDVKYYFGPEVDIFNPTLKSRELLVEHRLQIRSVLPVVRISILHIYSQHISDENREDVHICKSDNVNFGEECLT